MIDIWELTDDPKIKTKILAELEKRGNNLGIIGSKSGEIVTGKSTPMYKLQNEKKAGSTIFFSVAGFSRFGGENYLY